MFSVISVFGCTLLALFSALEANAQSYPNRAVRMIVPLAPGGSVDTLARLLAQKMTESMGQQVVVDNRGGASGNIGTELAVRAPADGYTILTVSMTLVVNPFLFAKLPFDVVKDLAPISLIGAAPFVLVAHPSVPARSVGELIALAKKRPGTLNYASAGKGTNSHLSMELLRNLTRINIVHVPYRGGPPGQVATLAGETDMVFTSIDAAVPQVRAGRFRAMGISSIRRAAVLPELPTIAEAGVPGYEFTTWYGALAPAGTPIYVINVLNDHIVKAVRAPDFTQRFANEGAEVIASAPAQLAAHIKVELARWDKVVKESEGLRAD